MSRKRDAVRAVMAGVVVFGGLTLVRTTTGGDSIVKPGVPGRVNAAVRQSTIKSTICVQGYTKTIRPDSAYTFRAKVGQIRLLKYNDTTPSHYEEDHLIPLELGGHPTSYLNLWPEPWAQADNSDPYENKLHKQVCNGTITLATARRLIKEFKRAHG